MNSLSYFNHNIAMANGEEDLKEKNKGREIKNEKRYTAWYNRLGREDSEMLLEKSSAWMKKKKRDEDY